MVFVTCLNLLTGLTLFMCWSESMWTFRFGKTVLTRSRFWFTTMVVLSTLRAAATRWSRRPPPPVCNVEVLGKDEYDDAHHGHNKCGARACVQCLYKAAQTRLRSAALLPGRDVTWLVIKPSGVGCEVCRVVGYQDTYGQCCGSVSSLKVGNLRRHSKSRRHVQAVDMMLKKTSSKVYATPSVDDFRATWEDVRAGKVATPLPGEKMQSRKRSRCQEWCLAEAVRQKHVQALKSADTIAVNADGRHSRLLMRFSCIGPDMIRREGTLGLERGFGSGNEAYTAAMRTIFERLATVGACRPHCPDIDGSKPRPRDAAQLMNDPASLNVHDTGAAGELDEEFLRHLRAKVNMAVADGAGDAQLAFEGLKVKKFLNRLVVRHYDQAHGARRLTSRPWQADPVTADVVETLIFGKHSLTMLFQNSPDLSRWLESNLKRAPTAVKAAALASGIRKHRFDSTQMPMARAVLRHEANIMTAIQITQARKGEFAALCAEYFLLYISGKDGMHRLLLLAMLTDAGDESAMVLRAQDKDVKKQTTLLVLLFSHV